MKIPLGGCTKSTGNVCRFSLSVSRFSLVYTDALVTVGAMAGYHSALGIHPTSSYGIIVLLGGHYPDATKLAYDALDILQPAFDKAHVELATSLYGGKWASGDGNSSASVVVEKGTLFVDKLVLNGSDVLAMFHAPGRLALRSSERRDEFR